MNTHKKVMKQSVKLKLLAIQMVACVVLGLIFLFSNIMVTGRMKQALTNQNDLSTYANQYRLASKTLTYSVQSYAANSKQVNYDNYMKELNTDKNRDIALEGMNKIGLTSSEQSYIDQISQLSNNLVPLEEEAFSLSAARKNAEAMSKVFGDEYEENVTKINQLTDDLIDQISSRTGNIAAKATSTANLFQILIIAAFILLVLEIIQFIYFSRKDLLRPIILVQEQMQHIALGNLSEEFLMESNETEVGQMVASIHSMKRNTTDIIQEISFVLNEMANGNYDLQIHKEYRGDFLIIKESLHKILNEMNETLSTVKQVADQVNNGADQLSTVSQDLAEGSTKQAGIVDNLVTTISNISDHIHQSAKMAKSSKDISTTAAASLNKGNERLLELISAIQNISDHSKRIGTIIETINGLAFQTNLLALNAAIEAARAGESGKGFAVVAEQVKTLAQASSDAVGDTSNLINATTQAVGKGIEIAGLTAKDITDVIEKAKVSTEMSAEVADSLNNEVRAISDVNRSIQAVAEVVESTSATAQETAATSEEQGSQVLILNQLIDKFKLR